MDRFARASALAAAAAVIALGSAGAGLGLGAGQQAAQAQAQAKDKVKPAAVPFEMLPTNHMLVTARINGKGPYRLIFDLGAPITLLSNRASEAAGVVDADAPARSSSTCGVRPRSRSSRPAA